MSEYLGEFQSQTQQFQENAEDTEQTTLELLGSAMKEKDRLISALERDVRYWRLIAGLTIRELIATEAAGEDIVLPNTYEEGGAILIPYRMLDTAEEHLTIYVDHSPRDRAWGVVVTGPNLLPGSAARYTPARILAPGIGIEHPEQQF